MMLTALPRAQVVEMALRNDPAELAAHAEMLVSDWLVLHTRMQQLEPHPGERFVRFADELVEKLKAAPSSPVLLSVEERAGGFLHLTAFQVQPAVAND